MDTTKNLACARVLITMAIKRAEKLRANIGHKTQTNATCGNDNDESLIKKHKDDERYRHSNIKI